MVGKLRMGCAWVRLMLHLLLQSLPLLLPLSSGPPSDPCPLHSRGHPLPLILPRRLKLHLLLQPLSYQVDLRHLTRYTDPATVDLTLFDHWINAPPPPPPPATPAITEGQQQAVVADPTLAAVAPGSRALCLVRL